nr:hypothetical protein [Tanacetum cinerariifolium]
TLKATIGINMIRGSKARLVRPRQVFDRQLVVTFSGGDPIGLVIALRL